MRQTTLIILTLILLAAVVMVGQRRPDPKQAWHERIRQRETPGPFPSDWFMMQRTWPDQAVSMDDYRAAAQVAERMAHRSLDDPPWVPAGPNNIGGRVADIVGHPTDPNIYYIASASGGIFKTTDDGQTWTSLFDFAPSLSMGALAMDYAHPDTIYAGTGEACSAGYSYFGTGVYRTTNGGATWELRGLEDSRYIARIAVDQNNPQSVWVAAMGELYITGGQRGVFHSTDGGETWEQSLFVNDSTGASDVVIHPTNSQIVLAGMWQRIRSVETRRAGGRGSGIFRSTNGGQSWVRITDGLPPQGENVGRIGLAISQSNPNIVYACYADHPGYFLGVYRSTDTGESWGQVNDGDLSGIYSSFGWYFGNIRVRPDNPDMIYVLGVQMERSTNGGSSWGRIGSSVHVDHHAMWFYPQQPTRILLGNDGGVYRSTNNGNSWTFRGGLPVNQFYAATVDFQHPERRYGGTQDNGTLRTMTGAVDDWDHILGGDGFYALVDPSNSNRIYAEYQYGGLERSEDGGDSWDWAASGIDENERINWSMPVEMSPSNYSTLYCGAQHVYRTTDRGDNWTAISPDLTDGGGNGNLIFGTVTTIGVSAANSQVIYAGTDDANVWVTRNGGQSWTNISDGLPNRWITRVKPDPWEENVVYVCISGFQNAEQDAHLFRSDNYGETWEDISGNLPAGPLNDVIPDPDVPGRLYVASDFGTYVTPDLGQTWLPLGEDLPRVPIIDLVLHDPTRQLTAATYGRSMYVLDLDALELNRPPVITDYTPADFDTLLVDQTVRFSVTAEDPDGDSLSYVWSRNETIVGTDSAIELEFAQADMNESIIVTVSDGQLLTSHSWDFYVEESSAARDIVNPAKFDLVRAYPNPFNAATTIEYYLPKAGTVVLRVFNLSGQQVATLLSGNQPAGVGRIQWTAPSLPSGTYLLNISAAGRTRTSKLMLIR